MTSPYFSELNKLKNSQKQIERYQFTIFDQLSKIQNLESQQLVQNFESFRIACDDTNCKLEVQNILDKLKYVRKAVIVECGNNITDLESFQEDLINVLNHIQDLKVQCKGKVEELITEQNQLNEDIKLYSERLCLWTESPKLDLQKNLVHSKIKTTNNDLPNDVRKFMDFVKVSNGHENGWTLSDHQLFLKLRKKFPDVNALCLNIHEMLPDISLEDVKRHEAWYVKYLNLKEKNNNAIKRWQKLKRENQTNDILDFVSHCENSEQLEKNPIEYAKTIEKNNDERTKVREEIENWKKEREIMRNIQQTMKRKQLEESKMKDKEREQKNVIKKAIVQKWKEEKLASAEEKNKSEETKNYIEQHVRVSVANKMIKYYQLRDKSRYDKLIKHDEKSEIPEKKRSTSQMSRDPKRLFRPTQQWIHRFLANNENNPIRPVNFIGRIPKLQKPSWRQSL